MGSPNGKIHEAFETINKINASKAGPFDIAILLGDVLPPHLDEGIIKSLSKGELSAHIPVFFTTGPSGLHKEARSILSLNDESQIGGLIYVGDKGTFRTKSGLILGSCIPENADLGFEKNDSDHRIDEETVADNSLLVDILFGSEWPANITDEVNDFKGSDSICKSDNVANIAKLWKPRYHFVCDPEKKVFWEREPHYYENNGNDKRRQCRFISLADYSHKQNRWYYAFKIDIEVGPDPEPYLPASTAKDPAKNFHDLWDSAPAPSMDRKRTNDNGQGDNDGSTYKIRRQAAPIAMVAPDSCFFCLSNPKIDRALIASIADECYIALAKGPLTSKIVKDKLGCPGHVLIIPLAHMATYKQLGQDASVLIEKRKYEVGLRQMYSQFGLSCVCFEISRSRGIHIHTQIVPIANDIADKVEETFINEGKKNGIHFKNRQLGSGEEEYLKIILPSGEPLVAKIDRRSRFDLQFCRRVLAFILGIDNQADWKACSQTPQEEAIDCEAFKKAFKSYDFSLE